MSTTEKMINRIQREAETRKITGKGVSREAMLSELAFKGMLFRTAAVLREMIK
jgi:hypothetical protein